MSNTETTTTPRPRWGRIALIVIAALVVIGVVVFAITRSASDATPQETVTAPSPTPTVSAITKTEGTNFFNVLPSTVNDYALIGAQTISGSDKSLNNPAEVDRLVYSNGKNTITLIAAQWTTEDKAKKAYENLSDLTALPEWALAGSDEATPQDAAVTVWENTTAVFIASGPAKDVDMFKRAFPM